MKRREFLTASLATAALAPAREVFPQSLAFLTQTIGALPAKTLDDGEIMLPATSIEALAGGLQGAVVLPGSADYDTVRQVWNGMFDKHPAIIARCQSAADVVQAIEFAREHSLLTAVRGGGHSYAGKSSCNGGIMIDLMPMRSVRVDPGTRTAHLAGGALLGQLDREAQAFGLATPAGVVSHTGVAGLTLGGGFGRLSRRFGLTSDNLIAVDLVTADGRYLRASEVENADLFWGLRGGGGNFGVVTSFEFRLHPMDSIVLSGGMVWPLEQAREVLRFYADYSHQIPDELTIGASLLRARDNTPLVSVSAFWSADHAKGERALEPLRQFGRPLRDTIAPVNYVALQSAIDHIQPFGQHYYSKTGFTGALSSDDLDLIMDVSRSATRPFNIFMNLEGGAVSRPASDATAFPNRDAMYWLGTSAQWTDPGYGGKQLRVMRAAWTRLEPITKGFYTNSAIDESDTQYQSNYGRNFARLVALKDKYDPTNLFRLNANVPPSIETAG